MSNKSPGHAAEKGSAAARKPLPEDRASRHQMERAHRANAVARAMNTPASELSASDILTLQRTAGNRAVTQLLAQRMAHEPPSDERQRRVILQAKLAVGATDDSYEREADRVAQQVVSAKAAPASHQPVQRQVKADDEEKLQMKPLASSITPMIQRQELPEEEEEPVIQRRAVGGLPDVEPGVEQAIIHARNSGQPLPADLRMSMEQAFGADFGKVRVHTDAQSDRLNGALQARAFTAGHDLFFKRGEYDPASRRGQELIAHELTHVVQQSGGTTGKRGLTIRRAPSDVIQRSVADSLRADRYLWKTLPTNLKLAAVVAAPLLAPFGKAWESGSEAAAEVYSRLAGDNPSIVRAVLSGLVATGGAALGGVYGLAKGFLEGLTFGIGNPLYSMGKRVVSGVRAIPQAVSEARGIYEADPRGTYGNLPSGARRENYNATTKADMANYLLLATSGVSSLTAALTKRGVLISQEGIGGFISDTNVPMLSETGQALSKMGAVGGVIGAVTSLVDARKGYKEWRDTARTQSQRRLGLGMALSSTASATQQSATAAYHLANLTQSSVAATAQVASGGAAIATGAVDIVRGFYGRSVAAENIARLERLQQTPALLRDTRRAATQAASTQAMRRFTATATIAKGALTAAGGILLAASMATPIGWTLLGIGSLVGLASAIKRWWDKRQRKEEIAMRELRVTKPDRENWEKEVEKIKKRTWWGSNERKTQLKNLGADPLQKKLDEFGFTSVGHFYANYINYMANYLYHEGTNGRMNLEAQVSREIENKKAQGLPLRHAELDGGDVSGLNYKQLEPQIRDEGIRVNMAGNHYPEVEEVVEGTGLKFNWRQYPFQPEPAKIGKALDE
ncbi:MAG: hypothetical protein V7641_3571 [Blastocatellia bacterium]